MKFNKEVGSNHRKIRFVNLPDAPDSTKHEPTSGVVAIRGQVVSDLKAKQIAKIRNTTFVRIPTIFLNAHETVLENATLPLKIAKVPKAERQRKEYRI